MHGRFGVELVLRLISTSVFVGDFAFLTNEGRGSTSDIGLIYGNLCWNLLTFPVSIGLIHHIGISVAVFQVGITASYEGSGSSLQSRPRLMHLFKFLVLFSEHIHLSLVNVLLFGVINSLLFVFFQSLLKLS